MLQQGGTRSGSDGRSWVAVGERKEIDLRMLDCLLASWKSAERRKVGLLEDFVGGFTLLGCSVEGRRNDGGGFGKDAAGLFPCPVASMEKLGC